MRPTFRKVWGSLRHHRLQWTLLAFALVISSVAVTTTLNAALSLSRQVRESFEYSLAPHIIFGLHTEADDKLTASVTSHEQVSTSALRGMHRCVVETQDGSLLSGQLFLVDKWTDSMEISRVLPVEGSTTAFGQEGVIIEQSSKPLLSEAMPPTVIVHLPGSPAQTFPVVGVLQDPARAPGWQDQIIYLYADYSSLQVDVPNLLNEVHLRLDRGSRPADVARAVLDGLPPDILSAISRVELPRQHHPHADHMFMMLVLLNLFALSSLMLAVALTAGLVSTLMLRERRQIAILRAMGATSRKIVGLYTGMFTTLAVGVSLIALPIGLTLSQSLIDGLSDMLNLLPLATSVSPTAIIVAALLTCGFPVGTSFMIVRQTLTKPLRELLAEHPGSRVSRADLVSTFFSRLCHPTTLLGLRSFQRSPFRAGFTLLALTVGGVLLLSSSHVYQSLVGALDAGLEERREEIEIRTIGHADQAHLGDILESTPEISHAEVWNSALVSFSEVDELGFPVSTERYSLLAPLNESSFFMPRIVEGRALTANSEDELLVNRQLVAFQPAIEVGSIIGVAYGQQLQPMRVVGIVEEVSIPQAYTTQLALNQINPTLSYSSSIRIDLQDHPTEVVTGQIQRALIDSELIPIYTMNKSQLRRALFDHFKVVLILLAGGGIASFLIGSISLTSSLSLITLERNREFGILRALGADRAALTRAISAEAFSYVGVSLLLTFLVSLLVGKGLCILIGAVAFHGNVPLKFSFSALVFVALLFFAVGGCSFWLPLRRLLARRIIPSLRDY